MTHIKTGTATNNGITITYETVGDPTNEPLILISGLGSQLVFWTDELCQQFLDRGFFAIRFDNRDVGLSSKTPGEPPNMDTAMQMEMIEAPYTLSDMAADTMSVLDALGIEAAHVVGTSLGGTIAQTVAIEHPQRVKSLTSIMSGPSPRAMIEEDDIEDEAVAKSLTMDMSDPATYVETQLEGWRATSGPHFDEAYQRNILQKSFDRCYHPAGWAYQMLAVRASGDRTERLGALMMPALVIHGAIDPLVPPSAGEATAAAIPGAKLLIVEDMGHNFPRPKWPQIADAIAMHAGKGH